MNKISLLDVVLPSLEDTKALDVRIMDVRSLTTITDTMVICTATSSRHAHALYKNLLDDLKKHNFSGRGVEGESEGQWILVDLSDVVVHVMQAETRKFYQLEELWTLTETRLAAIAQ